MDPIGLATDSELYARGAATLLASWDEYARGSDGGAVELLDGVAVAVFPRGPERTVYNNALLHRSLGRRERAAAVDAMAAAYDSAGVDHYAAWVHQTDEPMRDELSGRGYTVAETTLAMGMSLDAIAVDRPGIELEPLEWADYLAYLEAVDVPPGLLSGADPAAFHTLGARSGGATVASAIAFDHDGDCGLFNMSTVEAARRRGSLPR